MHFCTISESFRYKFSRSQNEKMLCSRLFEEYVAAFCFKNTPEWLQMSRQIEKV